MDMDNLQDQRRFFSTLIGSCVSCGSDVFQSVMRQAQGQATACQACHQAYQQFDSYWQATTGRADEVAVLAANLAAQQSLRRVFRAYSYKGIHSPLILPGTVKLEVTNRCNLHCRHCLASANSSRHELTLSQIESVLTQAKALGVNAIALVGGEPLLRPDLGDIIDIIYRLRLSFSISTNGTLLNEQIIATIKRKNLLKVSVSLDGDQTFHNELRGNPQAYQRALAGIRLLSHNGIKTAVAMVITRDNWLMVEHAINAAIDHGAAFFVVNDLIPVGRGIDIEDKCLSYPEYREHTDRMLGYSRLYGDRIKMLWKGMRPDGPSDTELGQLIKSTCGAGLTELTIDHEGYVLPCPFLPRTTENVLHKSLQDIWYNSDELAVYQRRDDLTGGCGTCSRKLSCSGCRARALGHTGDLKGPDVRCPVCQ